MLSSRQRITVIGTGCFGASIGLAVPPAARREIMQDVGRLLELNSRVVVTDIGNLEVPAIEWASQARPAGASGDAPSLRMAALLGHKTGLAGLEEVLVQLQSLRDMVAESDGEGFDTRLSDAVAGRARWMLETQTRAWQMTAETVGQGGLLERTLHMMFGEGLTKKPERSQGPF